MGIGRDLTARRRDGSEVAVEIGLTPVPTPDGMLTLAAIVDDEERRRLHELNAPLAARIAHSHDAILGKALDGHHHQLEPRR